MNNKELVQRLQRYYDSTKLEADGPVPEPDWVLPPFDELDECSAADLKPMVESIDQPKPYFDPIFGPRMVQAGIKIGTSSWVFLGRRAAIKVGEYRTAIRPNGLLVATCRHVPRIREISLQYQNMGLWCLWSPGQEGLSILYDHVPGTLKEVEEILAHPEEYGL